VTAFAVAAGTLLNAPCRSNVTLVFACLLGPLRPVTGLQEAMRTVIVASTATSSLSGNPLTGMSNTVLASLQGVAQCSFSLLDAMDGPLYYSYGEEEGQYLRGAVAAGLVAIGGWITLPVMTACAVPGVPAAEVLAFMRMPSSALLPVSMFLLSTVQSAVGLMRVGTTAGDVAMGVAGVALGVVCVAGALLWGTVWNRCRVAPRRSSAEHRQPRWRAVVWFRWFMEWDKHWVAPDAHEEEEGRAARIPLQAPEVEDLGLDAALLSVDSTRVDVDTKQEEEEEGCAARAFAETGAAAALSAGNSLGAAKSASRGGNRCKWQLWFFLDDMQAPWWAAIEVGRLLTAGLILGFRDNNVRTCRIQVCLLAAQALGMLVLAVAVRPFGSVASNFFLIVANFGALLVALFIALQVLDLSSASAEWAEVTTFVLGAIATLQTVLQLIVASASLLTFKSHLRAAARSVTRDPAATQDTSSSVPLSVLMADLDTADAHELPATDLAGNRRGPAQEAADESEATLPHPAAAVAAVAAAAADELDLEEAVDVNADSDLWRASERVAAARYVLRPEEELVDKSQSDLFMPLRSEAAPPAPLTGRKRKKKRRAPVAARSTSPEPEVPDDHL
jgi:hypothetical protein